MSAPLAAALESLSGYRAVFPPGDPRVSDNPVVFSHVHLAVAGKSYSVLSRISDYGLDYSQRANKIAHHLVLERKEHVSAGPAAVLSQPGNMESTWSGNPRIIPTGRIVMAADVPAAPCRAWQRVTGDAGWAGVLAESFQADPGRQAFLVVTPGMDVLSLLGEAIHLLPESSRWNVTFSTYFTSLPPGTNCQWRCVLAGSPEAQQSRRFVQALRIDLTQPMPKATGGLLVEQARTGRVAIAKSTSVVMTSPPTTAHSPIENPVTSDNPPLVPLDGGNRHGRQAPGSPPPPPHKRSRTLAEVPDLPQRHWGVPVTLAALVFLMLGAAGAGFYLWRPGDSLGQEVVVAGTDTKTIESPPEPAPSMATKTPTSTEGSQEPSGQSVAQGDVMPHQATPDAEKASEPESDPDTKDNPAPVATPPREVAPKSESPSETQANKEPSFSHMDLPEYDQKKKFTQDLKGLALPKSGAPVLSLLMPPEFEEKTFRSKLISESPSDLVVQLYTLTWTDFGRFALVTDTDPPKLRGEWLLSSPSSVDSLRWCVFEVAGDHPRYIMFRRPLKELSRDFKDGVLKWETQFTLADNNLPDFKYEARIALLVGDAHFVFRGPVSFEHSKTSKPTIYTELEKPTVALQEAVKHVFDSAQLGELPLKLSITDSSGDKSLNLTLVALKEFQETVIKAFDQDLRDDGRNPVRKIIGDQKTKSLLEKAENAKTVKELEYQQLLNETYIADMKANIEIWLKAWETRRADESDENQRKAYEDHAAELKKILGSGEEMGRLDELASTAKRIQSLENDLKAATITSAEISYTVQGADGKSLNVPILSIPELTSPQE